MQKARVFSVFFSFCLIICFCGGISTSAEKENDYIPLFCLSFAELDGGELEISLSLSSENGICAMMSELSYNEHKFLFLGCGSDQLNITYEDLGGAVRFLLDGIENSSPECILVTFYFKRIGSGEGEFVLRKADDGDCLYFDDDNKISSCKQGETEACIVKDPSCETSNGEISPRFTNFSLDRGEDRDAILDFLVEVGDGYIFAGIKVFAVDLNSGEYREYYMVGISRGGICSGQGVIELYEQTAVIITAVGYERSGMTAGEKRTEIIY